MITIKCEKCGYVFHSDKTAWEWMTSKPDTCPCCGNHRIHLVTYDANEGTEYVAYNKMYMDNQPIYFSKEDKNMKREQRTETQELKLSICRKYDTSRGIFKVKDLEPTDMFVLVTDEKETVYMAVAEEEPKYKTKKAVVKMVSGELSWIDDDTLIHVYRRPNVELTVGDFEYPND